MIKTFGTNKRAGTTLLALSMTLLSSCNPTQISSNGARSDGAVYNGALKNKSYVYRDSPAILDSKASANVDIARSVDFLTPELITSYTQLKNDCTFIDGLAASAGIETGCVQVFAYKSPSQQLLNKNSDSTWNFTAGSSEFYQVNNMYHLNEGIENYFKNLRKAYEHFYTDLPSSMPKALPRYLTDSKLYWFKAMSPSNDNYFRNSYLSSYAQCELELNARFSPAGPELCFGKWSEKPKFFMVQDPSIIQHELGHALIAVMMNFRNGTTTFPVPDYHAFRSNLGAYGYDEAGSIGEGVCDFFSYTMNKRTHFAEWGLTQAFDASRPISEDDSMHISGIAKTSEGRLSYPDYLLYDPNDPNVPVEDVHYAGQIVSHYLVALTESLKSKCSLPSKTAHADATGYVMMLLTETFAELGDLRARGYDSYGLPSNWSNYRFTNLDETSSYVWAHVVNPPTYRKFFQIFSKNINKYVSAMSGLCPSFTKNDSEKLLDDYGLLLFKSYNDNMNSTKDKDVYLSSTSTVITSNPPAPTQVQESNRRKSVLVSKELIELAEADTEKGVATYYIIDDKENMEGLLSNMLFKGFPLNLSTNLAGVEFNNNNIKISPGEVVAIIPNLKNNSNSTMAGIQLLANDWDHVHITDTTGNNGNFKPCVVDDVTTVDQGGVAADSETCANTLDTYRRHVKQTATNSFCKYGGTSPYCEEAVAPVCLVELAEEGSTRWVSQNEYRKKQGLALQEKNCLGYGYSGSVEDFTFNPHECLVRVLPGGSNAFYSKIDPQKSYVETMRAGNPDHTFSPSNAVILEVNKWIPPGTKFRCRLRARFSNCSDCFSETGDATNDDYIDAELNGHKPYKVINFEFEVHD